MIKGIASPAPSLVVDIPATLFANSKHSFIDFSLDKLKAKLEDIKEGKNNVILVYNGHEVDTGMKVDGNYISFNELH